MKISIKNQLKKTNETEPQLKTISKNAQIDKKNEKNNKKQLKNIHPSLPKKKPPKNKNKKENNGKRTIKEYIKN
jgi:hypothetical protein